MGRDDDFAVSSIAMVPYPRLSRLRSQCFLFTHVLCDNEMNRRQQQNMYVCLV